MAYALKVTFKVIQVFQARFYSFAETDNISTGLARRAVLP